MLPEVRLETASEVAARLILDAIVDGRFPPGAPLRLQDLSRQLGMSMMPVREAIRKLAAMDIVELEPRRGARVREKSIEDLQDTYFSRMVLETAAIREAARKSSIQGEELASEALAQQEEAQARGDLVAARDAHERFHFALYEASGSTWLVRSILPGWRNSERYRVAAMAAEQTAGDRAREHRQILDAVRAGDAERAVHALSDHLKHSVDLAMASLTASEVHVANEGQQSVTIGETSSKALPIP
jgi:DNA-binding GntR family transcriptional regulator